MNQTKQHFGIVASHRDMRFTHVLSLIIGILGLSAAALAQSGGSADLNSDSKVDQQDVVLLTEAWGPCPQPCTADLNNDGTVDGQDLAAMLNAVAGVPAAAAGPQAGGGNDGHLPVVVEAPPMIPPIPAVPPPPPPAPMSLDRPVAFVEGVNVHDLGAVPPGRIQEANLSHVAKYGHIDPGPKRVGFVREIDPPVSIAAGDSKFEQLADGNGLWTMEIRSPAAYYLRVHLEEINLGRSSMIIYGFLEDGTAVVKGPYMGLGPEGDGDSWSATVPGEVVRIEIVGPDQPQLTIAEIAHFDDPMKLAVDPANGEGGPAGGPLGCHLDVMCEPVNEFARQATGHMTWISGGNVGNCSGTLLNDLDNATSIPYFITAFHCLSTQTEVNTLEVVWFFQKDACNGTLPDFSTLPSNTGGSLLVTNNTDDGNDMTFIRLAGGLPGGIAFAGWTTASLGSGHGIHHPSGSWKRATWFDSGSGVCFDVFDYDYYEITAGAIEGGSSGSGIFNGSGQLSGQLYGFCGTSSTPGCPDQVGSTLMYGEFESTWEDTGVSYWLTLGGTIWVWGGSPNLPGNGTAGDPYGSVNQANNAAWDGAQIKIIAGSYDETLTISKAITVEAVNGTVVIGQ